MAQRPPSSDADIADALQLVVGHFRSRANAPAAPQLVIEGLDALERERALERQQAALERQLLVVLFPIDFRLVHTHLEFLLLLLD